MQLPRAIVVCAGLLAAAGCGSGEPAIPAWTIPLPEGTPVRTPVVPSLEERARELGLERELVLGKRPGDPRDDFFRPIDLAVDADGRVHVFDIGHHEIRIFDAAGEWTMTLGGKGQGPGEIPGGGRVEVAGEHVVHVGMVRMSRWNRRGTLVASPAYTFTRYSFFPVGSVGDSTLVGVHTRTDETGRWAMAVRVSLDGEIRTTYARIPDPGLLMLTRGRYSVNTRLPRPEPAVAVSPTGDVYVTPGDEYQVLAYATDGTLRWALRASWERRPVTDERIATALEYVRGISERNAGGRPSIDEPSASEVDWPERLPALAGSPTAHVAQPPIVVDGHGHLMVFPFVPDDWKDRRRPVDVYSRAGELLFSGLVPMFRWEAVHGDRVWSVEEDPITAEYEVVRYRLIEPFTDGG